MSLNPILFIISQIGIRPAFGANDGSINSGVMQSILTNFLLLFRFTISDSLFRRFFVLCWVYYTRSGVYCVGCFPGKFKTNRRIQVEANHRGTGRGLVLGVFNQQRLNPPMCASSHCGPQNKAFLGCFKPVMQ